MKYVIIVAGGKGLRMGADIPKQFLPIGGKPVLMHTISRFHAYDRNIRTILVLPKEQHAYWQGLCREHHFDGEYQLADGGASRFQSCRNGLSVIPDNAEGLVAIHDGVRPFVSTETIARCFDRAEKTKAAIPVPALYRRPDRRKKRTTQQLQNGADTASFRHPARQESIRTGRKSCIHR